MSTIFSIEHFIEKKLLIGAKEAGAGSLLAELIKKCKPIKGSVVLASQVASVYFEDLNIEVKVVEEDITNNEIGIIIDLISPDYVLVGASAKQSIEKQIILESQKRNYEVISFIDHYSNLWQRFAHEDSAIPWFYKPDFIFVINKICVNKLIKSGWSKDKTGINPHPLLNNIISNKGNNKDQILKKLNIPTDSNIILFVSEYNFLKSDIWNWEQSNDDDICFLLESLLEYVYNCNSNSINRTYILIKLHPAEDRPLYNINENYSGEFHKIIKNELDKTSLFNVSDIVVGLNSMLLLEASSYGLPVFSYFGSLQNDAIKLHEINKHIQPIFDLNNFIIKLNNIIKTI